jgi:hypothetical protein
LAISLAALLIPFPPRNIVGPRTRRASEVVKALTEFQKAQPK